MKKFNLMLTGLVFCFLSGQAQNLLKSMTFGGETRTYRIYVPPIYNGSAVPLVMALHGLGDDADNFQGVGFNQIANTENFIAVYPNALPDPLLGAAGWSAGVNPINNIDDVGFLNALLDTIQNSYSIDTNRIYVCGFSMGGFMTHRLACELGERIAAIATVAGTLPATMVANCHPGHPMPMLHIHGTSDQTIPYPYGVIFVVVTNLGADSTARFWASYNGCSFPAWHDSLPDTKSDGLTFEKFSYSDCGDSSEVILLKANGMTHTWPYSPANDIDATDEMWNFFSRHSKTAQSDTTSTELNEIAQDFIISPNPASDNILVKSSLSGKIKFVLTDLTGKEIYQNETSESFLSLPLNFLEEGIYMVTLTNQNSILTKKLVVEK